jgi:hypothetical protein
VLAERAAHRQQVLSVAKTEAGEGFTELREGAILIEQSGLGHGPQSTSFTSSGSMLASDTVHAKGHFAARFARDER